MRDVKIQTVVINDVSLIDLDIVGGEPVYVDEASQTNDQRAALACYACKGTVPGLADYGIAWSQVYDKSDTTTQLNNELQQQVQAYAGSSSADTMLAATQYNAMLLQSDEGMSIMVVRGGK